MAFRVVARLLGVGASLQAVRRAVALTEDPQRMVLEEGLARGILKDAGFTEDELFDAYWGYRRRGAPWEP